MAMYWATCTQGLEFSLQKELEEWDSTTVISTSFSGGVLFQSQCPPKNLTTLRSADNIYAFVAHIQGLPLEKEAAITFLKELPRKVDWNHSLETLQRWKQCQAYDCTSTSDLQRMPPIFFRVSCDRKCTNLMKHGFTSVEAEAAIGDGIHCLFGWPGSMRSYDVEVMVWIRDADILLTFSLLNLNDEHTKEVYSAQDGQSSPMVIFDLANLSLERTNDILMPRRTRPRPKRCDSQLYAKRSYRKLLVETSLKPSTAFSLLQLAEIRPGHILLDPMCGCGTIPLEAAQFYGSQVMSLAGDLGQKPITATERNSEGLDKYFDIIHLDAVRLPLRTGSIDRVICDMPFGVRCGSTHMRQWLCPKALQEIIRVLIPKTGIAVIMAVGKFMRKEIEANSDRYFVLLKHLSVHMEGIRAEVFVIQRTSEIHKMFKEKSKRENKIVSSEDIVNEKLLILDILVYSAWAFTWALQLQLWVFIKYVFI